MSGATTHALASDLFSGLASAILNENDLEEEYADLQLAHVKRSKVSAAYNHAK